ncbi:MAG: V-type ATP synthase subunit A [Candidatus Omnitrophica bacterium]|nr:V-type ATP synthase subunit A [Candidatus Omnitrophota bacterium]MDD5351652.1 V-type ATP synthase subunit A [Candidatus Omnitrophota bacterium]MDD5550862.1 V-type ATP synthase subunit A [Candidatus Omnitrophota bacterium]
MKQQATVIKVSGPLVVASGCRGTKMYDMVRVADKKLIGEIIELKNDLAYIQVYEETSGIGPGEPVYLTNEPLSVELGPGLMGSIYDGIQRPLNVIREISGDFISRGVDVSGLDQNKKWHFIPEVKSGQKVVSGDILGIVNETALIKHKIMVPPGISGEVTEIKEGDFNVKETIARIKNNNETNDVTMSSRWSVRKSRPVKEKLSPDEPLTTGQRVIDTFFPIAKGGAACIPGPFGAGKTVTMHEIAKWSDAQIIVYVACGERGNECADLLLSFPELKDPHTGRPLLERTVIVANTSNMPVAAREASIYTGITIAEYFRDMGYSVALMADSTSRWAEALREISGRLEEMPGEEGYPAYLSSRLAEFYERAGKVICLGADSRQGALSVMGAVSPPGGDLSDPVVQATLRVVKVFWGLDDKLANARHFPAINWLTSYSLYHDNLEELLKNKISAEFADLRKQAMRLLEEEASLSEIARLVGIESLSFSDRLILEVAKSIREDFLHQNAFHEIDTYTSLAKQCRMLKIILEFYKLSKEKLKDGADFDEIVKLAVREKISRLKYIEENKLKDFDKVEEELRGSYA